MPVTLHEIARYTMRVRREWLFLNRRYQAMLDARDGVQSGRLVLTYHERWVVETEIARLYHELCWYLPETWREG